MSEAAFRVRDEDVFNRHRGAKEIGVSFILGLECKFTWKEVLFDVSSSGAEDVFNLASTRRNRHGVSRSYGVLACSSGIKRFLIYTVWIQEILQHPRVFK